MLSTIIVYTLSFMVSAAILIVVETFKSKLQEARCKVRAKPDICVKRDFPSVAYLQDK